MQFGPIPDTNPIQECAHCHGRCNTWLWRLVEVYPEHVYEKLCRACIGQQEATFDAQSALDQAQQLTATHHRVCDSRDMMACPPQFRKFYPRIGGVE